LTLDLLTLDGVDFDDADSCSWGPKGERRLMALTGGAGPP